MILTVHAMAGQLSLPSRLTLGIASRLGTGSGFTWPRSLMYECRDIGQMAQNTPRGKWAWSLAFTDCEMFREDDRLQDQNLLPDCTSFCCYVLRRIEMTKTRRKLHRRRKRLKWKLGLAEQRLLDDKAECNRLSLALSVVARDLELIDKALKGQD
jgi:hypothetical protein